MEWEALNPNLYARVLDELELVPSSKSYQILFYGSRERGDYTVDSDLNFYLIAHSTDQMKSHFMESVSRALSPLEEVAPVNLIAGDVDSLRHRLKVFEPGSIQLVEGASIFFGEGLLEDLQKDWNQWKWKDIPVDDLCHYLEKRIRFFKQQVTRNAKEEIAQLERITTLSLHIWALKNISDLSTIELVKMDIPGQIVPLFRTLYKQHLDETTEALLDLQLKIRNMKVQSRWKREIPREDIHEAKYRLIELRKEEEFMLNTWA